MNPSKNKIGFVVCLLLLAISTLLKAQPIIHLVASDYNGYNISCFGSHDGSIDVVIDVDGTPPYSYRWSNEENTQNISNLASGYYRVTVTDADSRTTEAEITLREPEAFRSLTLAKYVYSNGKNVSCHFCFDGSITTTLSGGGVVPYEYQWLDGAVTQNRTGINAGNYAVLVTDANGCRIYGETSLSAPDRDDWTTTGNTGSTPGTHFIGTTDSKDLTFKTNSSSRMSISSSGTVKINSLSGSNTDLLYVDAQGNLLRGPSFTTYWGVGGNVGITSSHYIGTKNTADLIFKTDEDAASQISGCGLCGERMRIKANGQIAIGTSTISGSQRLTVVGNTFFDGKVGIGDAYVPTGYKLGINGNIICEEVFVKLRGSWPDYVFSSDYNLMSLKELEKFIQTNKHLPDFPSAEEVKNNDGITLGEMNTLLTKKIEELTLYILQQNNRIEQLEKILETK